MDAKELYVGSLPAPEPELLLAPGACEPDPFALRCYGAIMRRDLAIDKRRRDEKTGD